MPDRHSTRWAAVVILVGVAAMAAACSSGTTAATTSSTSRGPAGSGGAPATVRTADKPPLGSVLVAANGMTLYRFSPETNGQVMCTGTCASVWKPLTVPSGQAPTLSSGVAGTLGTVTRPGGATQVTYDGHPLYFFSGDMTTADTKGQGVEHLWFVLPPSAASSSSTTSPPAPTTTSSGGYGY